MQNTFLRNIFRQQYWLDTIDNSQLIIFRIVFGLVLTAESFGGMATKWTYRAYVEPEFTFNFIGMDFLQIFVGEQMYILYTLFGICGLLMTFGAFYRVSAIGAAILWSIIYFGQKTNYNNHYYLIMILCWIMVFLPANQYFSYDAKRKPEIQSISCPRWSVLIFVVLLLIVYTYASIAKIYPGWIAGEPMEIWFGGKRNYPLIGEFIQNDVLQTVVAIGGILFDLLIIPMLLWKPTRWLGVAASFVFHIFNSIVFQIGTFPYLMLGSMVLFFEAEQVRKLFFKSKPVFQPQVSSVKSTLSLSNKNKLIIASLSIFFAFQVLLPLRHHLYPGDVLWNEEGHRYSWRMMLRAKTGKATFKVINNETGKEYKVNPTKYMTYKQAWSMAIHPDMLWQFIQILKKDYAQKGMTNISIYVDCKVKINKSPYRTFINPEYDMAKAQWHRFKHSEWIMDEPIID